MSKKSPGKFDDNEVNELNNKEHVEDKASNEKKVISNNEKQIKSLKEELLYFKNDVLKDLKSTENRINQKYESQNNQIKSRLEEIEKKTNMISHKFSILTDERPSDNINKEKIAVLESFKKKTEDYIPTIDFRINNLNNELRNTIIKYDRVILDSIVYPGIIGKQCQFKTFHELIDFLLVNVNRLLLYKDKSTLEAKEYKIRFEETKETFNNKIEFHMNNTTEFVKECIKNTEDNLNKQIKDLNEKLANTIVDFNVKFNVLEGKIANHIEDRIKKLNKSINDINIKLTADIEIINTNYENLKKEFELSNEKNYNLIKEEIGNTKSIVLNTIKEDDLNYLNQENINFINKTIEDYNNNKNNNDTDDKNINNFNINFDHIISIIEKRIKTSASSIIKQYIEGMIKYDEVNKKNREQTQELRNAKMYNDRVIINDGQIYNINCIKLFPNQFNNNKRHLKNANSDILNSEESNHRIRSSLIVRDMKNKDYYTKDIKNKLNNTNSISFYSNITNDIKDIKCKQVILNQSQNFKTINKNNEFIEENSSNYNNGNNLYNNKKYKYKNENNSIANIKKEKLNQIFNSNTNYLREVSVNKLMSNPKNLQAPQINDGSMSDIFLSKVNINDENKSLSVKKNGNEKDNLNNEKKNNYFFKLRKERNNKSIGKFLFSPKEKKFEYKKFNKYEVNFDDDNSSKNEKDNLKFQNNVKIVKDILPKEEKEFFVERMKKLGFKKDNKKTNDYDYIKNIKSNLNGIDWNSLDNNQTDRKIEFIQ